MDEKTTPFNSNDNGNGRERKKATSKPPLAANGGKHLANTERQPAGNQPAGNQPFGNQPAGNQPAGNQPADSRPVGNQLTAERVQPAGAQPANDLPAEALSRRKRRKAAKAAKRAANPRKYKRRRRIVAASSLSVALAVGTGTAWALNRYVIDHVEISNVKEYEAKQQASASNAAKDYSNSNVKTTVTDSSYTGANGTVKVEQIATGSGTTPSPTTSPP